MRTMLDVRIGTCGWSARGGRKVYFNYFKVVELQETFYRLPRLETAVRWREKSPSDFEFTVKAWQVITHPPTSPTWRRCNLKIGKEDYEKYGFFRPTTQVYDSWRKIRELCTALRTKVCIFQTPPKFGYSADNYRNVEEFFSTIERGGLLLGWEPRGTWHEHRAELKRLLESIDVTHVVDPLRREPVYCAGFTYFRLHGLGGREVNYRYKYTDEDLARLLDITLKYVGDSPVYVMFNNGADMFRSALRFKELLEQEG